MDQFRYTVLAPWRLHRALGRCANRAHRRLPERRQSQIQAVREIRYRKIRILPPIGKQKRYPTLTLTVIHAEERGTLKNRKKIDWKLITDLPIGSRTDAIEKLEWYAIRFKIEVPQDPQIRLQD